MFPPVPALMQRSCAKDEFARLRQTNEELQQPASMAVDEKGAREQGILSEGTALEEEFAYGSI